MALPLFYWFLFGMNAGVAILLINDYRGSITRLFPRQELSFRALILTIFIAWFVGALIGYAAHGNIINFIKWILGQG